MDLTLPQEKFLQQLDLEALMDLVETKIDREIGFIKSKDGQWVTDYNNYNTRTVMNTLAGTTRKEAVIKLINLLDSGANLGDTDPEN